MKLNRIKIALVYLVIAASIACNRQTIPTPPNTPADEPLRKALNAGIAMRTINGFAIDVTIDLAKTGLITSNGAASEDAKIMRGLQKISAAIRVYGDTVTSFTHWNEPNRTALVPLFKAITDAVSELNQQEILGIKNPKAKEKISAVLAGLSATFVALELVLNPVGGTT